MKFKVGDEVKILFSGSDHIPEIEEMIGLVFLIDEVNELNYCINGWYFDEEELDLVKE